MSQAEEGRRVLPTFLGIGVPRAATTWLHDLLAGHGEVFVPRRRKEIHFFDKHFERGLAWYSGFFPARPAGARRAVGEITPHYLFCKDCPDRIRSLGTVQQFIVMLRDPVARAYSHYGLKVRNRSYGGTFEDFLSDHPEAIAWGRYASHLRRYFDVFGRERFLVLVQEEVAAVPAQAAARLALFLGVREDGFRRADLDRRVNPAFLPRWSRLYRLAMTSVRWLVARDADWPIRLAKRLGVKQVLARGTRLPELDPQVRDRLAAVFATDVLDLEELLGRGLAAWRPGAQHRVPAP